MLLHCGRVFPIKTRQKMNHQRGLEVAQPNKGKEHPADVSFDSWTSSGYKALDKLGVISKAREASSLSL